MKDIKLTKYTKYSGCGAKLGPALLDKALCGLEQPVYPNLLVDFTTSDDAAVYQVDENTAIVQTLDFFPPIVNDPELFGEIAAANALSDVYAMGGKPITALSIVGFPLEKMPIGVLRKMTNGALNKLKEAGAALCGGHSIEDTELKFGLSVTGIINPQKVWKNNTLESGQTLILTKALGTGVLNMALRKGKATNEEVLAFTSSMRTLNKKACEVLQRHPVKACTDVTGFGLIGHSCEMIVGGAVDLEIDFSGLELLPGALEYAKKGWVPGGTGRNREFRGQFVQDLERLPSAINNIIFDPQTSGGLLVALKNEDVPEALEDLRSSGVPAFSVGTILSGNQEIRIKY